MPAPEPTGIEEPVAREVIAAMHAGDIGAVQRLLDAHPGLARARLGDPPARSLLHVVTDWPGHYPNAADMAALLVEAGADVNARFSGSHDETPLHWAASGDDVEVLDALLAAGADIEAPGSVIAGGTPLNDAVAFGQWQAARRLVVPPRTGRRTQLGVDLGRADSPRCRPAQRGRRARGLARNSGWQARG